MAITKATASSVAPAAKGDLVVGSGTNDAAVLAVGTNDYVLTADSSATNGVKWAAPAGGGKVLQVVYGSTSTGVATASATYIDTGLTATITPSSTASKVLVITNHVECSKNGDTRMRMKLLRGATDILQLGQNTGNTNNSNMDNFFIGCSYLDSPATTSATTYKTQFNNQDATGNTQVTGNNTCVSTMILMEIGA